MSISRYKPIRRMAIGGMAEVLLASQQSLGGFERLVVVKRILPHLREDQEFAQMFLDEARLAATLQHQNIVETLDVYREEESFSVALEYISGEDLRYIIGRARKREITIPVSVACRVVADIASALDYVHSAADMDGNALKVVHRDVAPSNIIVGYSGVAKLIDFGIAKARISHIYTRPGTLKGKFAYMSPEQIRHKDLDGRSDIFSLSIVLYEMLTARRLFKGPSQAAVLQSVMERSIVPPSEINPEVPPDLERIVLRGLERERDQRFASAGQLCDDLEALLGKTLPMAGSKQVAEWMATALNDRRQQRIVMEREVVQAAREPEQFVSPTEPSLLPLFTQSVSGATQSSSQTTSNTPEASQGLGQVPGRPSRPWLMVLVGAVGALALVAAVIIGLVIGMRGQPVASRDTGSPEAASTLVVHALPAGGQLLVNGVAEPRPVGPEGLMVSRTAGSKITLQLRKDGFQEHRTELTMPTVGTQHVNIYLTPMGPSAPVVVTRPDPTETAPVEAKTETHEDVRETAVTRPRPRPAALVRRRNPTPRPVPRPAPPRAPAPRAPAPVTGALLVAFSPPNATVYLDGQLMAGTSPMRFAGLPTGEHLVVVKAAGHDSVSRTTSVQHNGESKVDIRLPQQAPVVGTVDVVTDPTGAAVEVDGAPKGRSPIMGLELPARKPHRIEVKLSGYKTWSTRVTPSSGRNPTVMATLTPVASAPVARAEQQADTTVPRSLIGSRGSGQRLFESKCARLCHSSKISSRKYTADQWSRYFAYGRHTSKAPLSTNFSRSNLADVKAYLMSVAADVERDTAAGVR